MKYNFFISALVSSICLYSIECYFVLNKSSSSPGMHEARKLGVAYDPRTSAEVIADLRTSGVLAVAKIAPENFVPSNGLDSHAGRIFPLSMQSNTTTILNNESGFYPIIETDEQGFNNSKGYYQAGESELVLLGDSFTEGWGVERQDNIAGVLNRLGLRSLNLGQGGNGPLIELATLKEYAAPLRPKVVLWIYFANDFYNLHQEIEKATILKRYLSDDDYTQKLYRKRDQIDEMLFAYAKAQEVKSKQVSSIGDSWRSFVLLMKLTEIRKIIGLVNSIDKEPRHNHVFPKIIEKARALTDQWGGQFYLVILPSYYYYTETKRTKALEGVFNEEANRQYILKFASTLKIPVIDIHEVAFRHHPDPPSLFPFRIWGHYNSRGYSLVAEAIANRLKADGFRPKQRETKLVPSQ